MQSLILSEFILSDGFIYLSKNLHNRHYTDFYNQLNLIDKIFNFS